MKRIFIITNDAIMSILIHIFFHIYVFMLGRVLEVSHILFALKVGVIKYASAPPKVLPIHTLQNRGLNLVSIDRSLGMGFPVHFSQEVVLSFQQILAPV